MMICHYFSFLIDEIWLDWWNNILLFLFTAFTELNLIYGIWAFSIIAGWAFILSWHLGGGGLKRTTSLGLASGPVSPFF